MSDLERRAATSRLYRRLLLIRQDFQGLGYELDPHESSYGAMCATARQLADDAAYDYERYRRKPKLPNAVSGCTLPTYAEGF